MASKTKSSVTEYQHYIYITGLNFYQNIITKLLKCSKLFQGNSLSLGVAILTANCRLQGQWLLKATSSFKGYWKVNRLFWAAYLNEIVTPLSSDFKMISSVYIHTKSRNICQVWIASS
jgi:hypothetical protein